MATGGLDSSMSEYTYKLKRPPRSESNAISLDHSPPLSTENRSTRPESSASSGERPPTPPAVDTPRPPSPQPRGPEEAGGPAAALPLLRLPVGAYHS